MNKTWKRAAVATVAALALAGGTQVAASAGQSGPDGPARLSREGQH